MNKEYYFTITATNMFNGVKPYKVGRLLKIIKEVDNSYDCEAISVNMRYAGKSGYVANSVRTVAKGTMSAGRLYDKILDEDYAITRFILGDSIIAKVLTEEDLEKERNNPESDIHFI